MPFSKKIWSDRPLQQLADNLSLKTPGMYLIALRTHLNAGKNAIGNMLTSVAEALPKPSKFLSAKNEPEEEPRY